jgi:hypothetical protein
MIFVAAIQPSPMRNKNNYPSETEAETFPIDSEDSIESIKFIKKLELQRSILKKLLIRDSDQTDKMNNIDHDSFETNKSFNNQ